ncbi:c-type cytochrome [Roseovarius nanhaiticus]|uniref:c-type cytochrome n=1 Tax=Roseovarius nanhaiticus TaxID=573024 RepID=UPI002492E89E|nr:c-type cytochrome [Roseovarius nanhaiticus]
MTRRALALAAALVAALASASARADTGAAPLGDANAGEAVFDQCKACHQVGPGATDRVGPHLNRIFGRQAASHDGYRYSDSMARAGADGLIWTAKTLDAYIENPRALVSKTRMSFRGLKDPEDRANLLAYLRIFSDNPSDLPEAAPTARGTDHDLDPAILALVGDAEYGEYLSSECLTCHQADGSAQGIPGITGWPTEDFVVAMHAYKSKLRPHPVMQMMAGRLNDEEIAALAAYFKELD